MLRIADLRVDPKLDEILKAGHTVKLEPKAMQLLICLAERAGEVLSVEELLDLVWKDVVVSHDSVYAAVAALRRTLGDDPRNPTYIANIARRGYRLIAPVSPWVDPPADPTAKAAPAAPDKPSIAVMPFLNLSGDTAQEYFSDGITEDIITELSRWRRLAVRSRSASFRYRGVAVDTKQLARELGVRFVVEGSVRRMGERVRISVQLIDADTGSHIWSEKFDRGLDELFAVQDRVVQTIVSTLVGRVEASDTERARRKPPASLAAYECVLKCNALSWDDPAGAAEATRLVEKAIELDPGYALAHALLAALSYSRWDDGPRSSAAALEKAYVLAMRAVELDDGESTCHAILGHICLQRRSFELAVQYSRRAVEINPNNQWNAADLGSILVYVDESEEALTWLSRAREIDPYFDQAWYWRAAGLACMNLHRYADALSQLSRARVRAYPYAALIAGCHAQLGDMNRARASIVECLSMKPDLSITQFMSKEPFKVPADAEHLACSLRLAGLPDCASIAGIQTASGGREIMTAMQSIGGMVEPAWVTEVLHFWFDELGEAHWFAKREDIDAQIRDRFRSVHDWVAAHDGSVATAQRPLLAAVIVLDQFSRNLFRGTPSAFAADPVARRLARTAIKQGFDVAMKEQERLILYMPFEHSEDREDQALAVELIARLGNEAWTRDAIAHKAIIDRFGRFPHRNTILNRHSSADEVALLKESKGWWL